MMIQIAQDMMMNRVLMNIKIKTMGVNINLMIIIIRIKATKIKNDVESFD